MEKKLRDYLRTGEVVCWQGKPQPFSLLDCGTKSAILRKWILTVLIIGGVLIAYIPRHGSADGFVWLMLLLAAVLILSPIVERSNLMQNRYWITNQRAILMSRDGSFYYMDLADIDTYEVIRGKSDQDCLALGGEIQEDAKKYVRWRSCHPKEDMTGAKERDHVKGLMFYNIANIADAVAQLKKSESSAA